MKPHMQARLNHCSVKCSVGWSIAGGEFSGRVPVQLPGLAGVCFQFDVSSHMICRVEYPSMIQGTALLYVSYKSLNRQRYRLWRPAVSQVVVNHFGGGFGSHSTKKKGTFTDPQLLRNRYYCTTTLRLLEKTAQRLPYHTEGDGPSGQDSPPPLPLPLLSFSEDPSPSVPHFALWEIASLNGQPFRVAHPRNKVEGIADPHSRRDGVSRRESEVGETWKKGKEKVRVGHLYMRPLKYIPSRARCPPTSTFFSICYFLFLLFLLLFSPAVYFLSFGCPGEVSFETGNWIWPSHRQETSRKS